MSRVIVGMAKMDPDPPIGGVRVVDTATGHSHVTTSDSVTLKLYSYSSDVKDFRVRNLGGSYTAWIPMVDVYPRRLKLDSAGEGVVSVQYRATGPGTNRAEYNVKIRVVPSGSVGAITGRVAVIVNGKSAPPGRSGSAWPVKIFLPRIPIRWCIQLRRPPGRGYKLLIQYGDEQIEQADIEVVAGSTTRPSGVTFYDPDGALTPPAPRFCGGGG